MSRVHHHRGHRRGPRSERPLQWLVTGSFAILGLTLLMAIRLTSGSVAVALWLCVVAAPVLVAFLVVSCVTGRAAALVTNFVQLCIGQAGLEKLAHESRKRTTRTPETERVA